MLHSLLIWVNGGASNAAPERYDCDDWYHQAERHSRSARARLVADAALHDARPGQRAGFASNKSGLL